MAETKQDAVILVAEDDQDDQLLIKEAFDSVGLGSNVVIVEDGVELMDYLHKKESPQPQLIVLDLNMPRKDGRVALQEIKSHPTLRRIPVIGLTTSHNQDDILHTYDLGVNSLIQKPLYFEQYVEIARTIKKYWLDVVHLPIQAGSAADDEKS